MEKSIALYKDNYELLGIIKCEDIEKIYQLGEWFRLRFNSSLKFSSDFSTCTTNAWDLEISINKFYYERHSPFIFTIKGENLKEVYENCSNGESLKQFIQDSIILKFERFFSIK